MDSVVIAFSHLPRDDRGNKPCDEKNPNIITFSHLTSIDLAVKPCNEKNPILVRFFTCLHLIVPINHAMKKYFIDLIPINCIFTLARPQLIVQETMR